MHQIFILGAYYGLYLSGAVNALVPSRSGHLVLETVFLAAGLLFAVPILATDPVPGRASPVVSLLEQFIEMGLHAFFGVIVMFGGSLLVPAFAASTRQAGLDPLEDQRIAGALAWSYGEGPAVVLLIVLMHRWFRADTRRAAARDARVAAEGDRELDAYNAYLAGLTEEQDPTRRHGSRRPGPESDTG